MSCSRCRPLVRMSPRNSWCCGDAGSTCAVVQQLGEADDRVERRAQLVRHVREELALEPVRFLDAAVLQLELDRAPADLLDAAALAQIDDA